MGVGKGGSVIAGVGVAAGATVGVGVGASGGVGVGDGVGAVEAVRFSSMLPPPSQVAVSTAS